MIRKDEDKQRYSCAVVQDLLPLYIDDVCSETSRKIVEEHLHTCDRCRETLKEMTAEREVDMLKKESEGVLKLHEQHERSRAWKAGMIISGILVAVVLIAAVITTMNSGNVLTVLVIASSMLLIGGMIAVPFIARKGRAAKAVITSIVGLLFIIYFVDRMNGGGHFLLYSIPTVFGLSLFLVPVVLSSMELPPEFSDKKGLISMIWDTVFAFLTVIVCCANNNWDGLRPGLAGIGYGLAAAWAIFLTARYLPVNRLKKAGLISLLTGIFTAFANDIIHAAVPGQFSGFWFSDVDFTNPSPASVNADFSLIVLTAGCVAGAVLLIAGIVSDRRKKGSTRS
jgi:hypothetical protein